MGEQRPKGTKHLLGVKIRKNAVRGGSTYGTVFTITWQLKQCLFTYYFVDQKSDEGLAGLNSRCWRGECISLRRLWGTVCFRASSSCKRPPAFPGLWPSSSIFSASHGEWCPSHAAICLVVWIRVLR